MAVTAPSIAREEVTHVVSSECGASRVGDVGLVVSEIVTNAVRYGAGDESGRLRLDIRVEDDVVRVRVEQPGSAAGARIVEPSTSRGGGFGLRLVDALTDEWGVDHGPPGCVWFRMPCADRPT